MENRTKEVFFPKSLEIGYLLTQEAKVVIEIINKIDYDLQENFGINLDYELLDKALGKRHSTDERESKHLLLKIHTKFRKINDLVELENLKDDIELDEINQLIGDGYLEVDTTDSLFKFLYEEFGNYNQISTRTNTKNERINLAVLMYEFISKYSNEDHFRENLMNCYNESTRESVDHLDIESLFDMVTQYQSKVDELGL